MMEADARRIAKEHRQHTYIPVTSTDSSAHLRYIEIAEGYPQQPAPVRDVLAWVVRFNYGAAWSEVAIDDKTSDVVRVEYSRGAGRE